MVVLLVLCSQHSSVAQTSRFEKIHEWSDVSGKFKKRARVVSANSTKVVLETESGDKVEIPLKLLCSANQEFVESFRERVLSDLKKQARASVYAADVLQLYNDYNAKGFVDSENRVFVETKISELEKLASKDAIVLPDGYVSKADLPSSKRQAKTLVDQWILEATSAGSGEEQKVLRQAIKSDPTSIESVIVLALFYEVYEADSKTAQRHLDAAIERGIRYLPLGFESDKANLFAALNNMAVSCVKSQQVSKAQRFWERALGLSSVNLPEPIKHNVAKTNRMINKKFYGLSADKTDRKEFGEFATRINASGGAGGWQLMCPADIDGTVRTNLQFILADKRAQQIAGEVVVDTRCVKCDGTSQLQCAVKQCKRGVIRTDIWGDKLFRHPNGTVVKMGRVVIRVDVSRCRNCSGDGLVDCPCCDNGMQN